MLPRVGRLLSEMKTVAVNTQYIRTTRWVYKGRTEKDVSNVSFFYFTFCFLATSCVLTFDAAKKLRWFEERILRFFFFFKCRLYRIVGYFFRTSCDIDGGDFDLILCFCILINVLWFWMRLGWVGDGVVFVCDTDNLKWAELYTDPNNNFNRYFYKS